MRWFVGSCKVMVVAAVGLFVVSGVTGYRASGAERRRIDPTVRSSPGGYRSFHFWHSGSAGGK